MKNVIIYCDAVVADGTLLTEVISADHNMACNDSPHCGTITLAVTEKMTFTRDKYTPTMIPQPVHPDSARLTKVRQMLADARANHQIAPDTHQRIMDAMQ